MEIAGILEVRQRGWSEEGQVVVCQTGMKRKKYWLDVTDGASHFCRRRVDGGSQIQIVKDMLVRRLMGLPFEVAAGLGWTSLWACGEPTDGRWCCPPLPHTHTRIAILSARSYSVRGMGSTCSMTGLRSTSGIRGMNSVRINDSQQKLQQQRLQ
jgi:hypothetical protein